MAIRPFNSVGGFSIGENPTLIIDSNGNITTTRANLTGNMFANAVLTDNLLYANGQPWDLQEAAGSNGFIQFNNDNNFGASANLTYNNTTGVMQVGWGSGGEVKTDTVTVTGNVDLANLKVTNYANIANAIIEAGNVTATYFIGDGSQLTGLDTWKISNGQSNVFVNASNVTISANGTSDIVTVTDTGMTVANITTPTNSNLVLDPNGTGVVVIANASGGAVAIELGAPTQGNLVSNAITLTNSSSVSNAIAQLNEILGKLVPPSPPAFPASQTLSVQSLSTYRMANFVQTDNTPGLNKNVSGGTTVTNIRRSSSYTTSNITTAGPGDNGTVTVYLNGASAGSRTLTTSLNGNGTYSNLRIYNNFDYNSACTAIAAGFWSVFSSNASGTVTEGWNEVYIAHSAAGNTNTPSWYYDASTPGTPTFTNVTFAPPGSPTLEYTSTVPHYTSATNFDVSVDVSKLSGDTYPTSDTFFTGTAGGAFNAPASKTYIQASITTPLARNLYVSSGAATVTTTAAVISGFGSSSGSPSVSVTNSYNTGTQTLSPGSIVLYKTGTSSSATRIEEANVYIGSTIGSGSGLAFRIINPGSTDNPSVSASASAFNSQSSTLESYDATVVANVLKHDQTNYSTGYLPAGPNLSSGRTGAQYFTFKFIRTSVSKFDIKWTGTLAGLWIALPGSAIDTSSTIGGWLDLSIAYAGAGQPGAGTGGNGSNGAALGGTAPLNSAQTNKRITATFGTVSSSSTATNEIYVRIKLTSGQSITALSLETASN